MFGHHFHSLDFVGAQSDALPIRKHEPLMTANFPDYVLSHFGARQLVNIHYASSLACLLTPIRHDPCDLLVVTICAIGKPSLISTQRRLFHRRGPRMNYPAFTNGSLTMMYEGVRGALAADDALERDHREPVFRVRETPDWKKHAADLEAEMLKRGMMFQAIDWSEGQGNLFLEE